MPVWGQKKPQAQVVKIVIIPLQMFGGVPQPQTSRDGPKRPETAGRVWRVSDAAGRRPAERKFIAFLLLAAIKIPFTGAAAAKQGGELSTSLFRPLNLRVSARAILLRSRYYGTVQLLD